MVQAMEDVARSDTELSVEERNLLSVAFKNVIGARRASWRIVSSIESKETSSTAKLEVIQRFRKEIEDEVMKICKNILSLLDDHLIPSAKKLKDEHESCVFYKKM